MKKLVLLVMAVGATALGWSGTFTLKSTLTGDFDWSDGANYEGEPDQGPQAGDTVVVPSGLTVTVNAAAAASGGTCGICEINVASGATLNIQVGADGQAERKAPTYFYKLTGSGTVNNTDTTRYQEIHIKNSCTFDGKITGKTHTAILTGVRFLLTDADQTTVGSPLVRAGATAAYSRFAKNGNSPLGSGSFNLNTKSVIEYVGGEENQGETFSATIWTGDDFIFDAGNYGGFTYSGRLGSGNKQWNMVLTGDNCYDTYFKGYRDWNATTSYYAPYAVSKRGTGTWYLKDYSKNLYTSLYEVQNGTLKYDTLAAIGTMCSFGQQDARYPFGTSTLSDSAKLSYAILLGGGDDEEGLLECGSSVTTSYLSNYDRVIAIANRGGLRSSTQPIAFSGITTVSAGAKTLILEGTQDHDDVVWNLTDGVGTLGIEKRGTGTWTVKKPADITGKIAVKNGTLKISNGGSAYKYYRLVFKQTAFHDPRYKDTVAALWPEGALTEKALRRFTVTEFFLFDKDGKRVNRLPMCHYIKDEEMLPSGKIASNTYTVKSTAGIQYWLNLQPGQFAVEDPTHYADWITCSSRPMAALFEGGSNTATAEKYSDNWHYNDWMDIYSPAGQYLDGETEENFIKVILRLPEGSGAPVACDFCHHYDSTSQYCGQDLTMFEVDGSVDGLTWDTLVDETVTALAAKGSTSPTGSGVCANITTISAANLAKCYQFTQSAPSVTALALNSPVEVSAGATLACDGPVTISKLVVGTTMGTLSGDVTLAENGTIDLPRIPTGETSLVVPTTLKDVAGSANLANWTMTVAGGPKCYDVAYDAETGTFTLTRKPLKIILK